MVLNCFVALFRQPQDYVEQRRTFLSSVSDDYLALARGRATPLPVVTAGSPTQFDQQPDGVFHVRFPLPCDHVLHMHNEQARVSHRLRLVILRQQDSLLRGLTNR